MRPTITNLARHPHGYWTAQLADSGHTIDVDTRSGSWQTAPDDAHRTREVLPHVAAVLQERVRRLERKRTTEATR